MKNTRRNKKKLRMTKFGMKFAKDFEKHWKRIEKENPLIDNNKYEL